MSAVYDHDTKPNDPLVSMIRGAMDSVIHAETPDKAAIIDSYPALTSIPAWFPGASFKCHALELKSVLKDMIETPFEYALDRIVSTYHLRCAMLYSGLANNVALEQPLNNCALQTHSTLLVFIQAMVLNPEVQKRAQAEIDRVVGTGRLPDWVSYGQLVRAWSILRAFSRRARWTH
ncbi:hypothetical protein CY34DRAFT_785483, partial [Suillus luteus UH-Slu-Lm8-n1]